MELVRDALGEKTIMMEADYLGGGGESIAIEEVHAAAGRLTSTSLPFEGFPKIARFFRDVTITEKIDGTNAQIIVQPDGRVTAASKNRLIVPGDDNHGFARWVKDHELELSLLGEGRHYGEWWGRGIGRNYSQTGKRFSLFNTYRWGNKNCPPCCDVVPILYYGVFKPDCVYKAIAGLKSNGSIAAPGFMKPEGIVMWHDAAKMYFKVTIENDEKPKGSEE